MEENLIAINRFVAMSLEVGAAVVIAVGAIEAFARLFFLNPVRNVRFSEGKRDVWLRFATWLVIALEFELAADVLRTVISPSWNDVGQLAVIAFIRTFLNYFLEKDIVSFSDRRVQPNAELKKIA